MWCFTKLSAIFLSTFASWFFSLSAAFCGNIYYVSNNGMDSNTGVSQDDPWKTIAHVNKYHFLPGDKILFRRGDRWREQLRPQSGNWKGYITYGAYGSGPYPILLGSIDKSKSVDWTPNGQQTWFTIIKYQDVGNIIFDNGEVCGTKKWHLEDMNKQGDFYFDRISSKLYLFSATIPSKYYKKVECALTRHIIDESNTSYIIYQNLDLKYGAAHGIGGGNTHHIIIRSCDISFIGGGLQSTKRDGTPVRYGNGIEFWGKAHDNLVENCKLWDIYDAALTNQNKNRTVSQYNITYRNNVIWNSEYSFEYWNRPASSTTYRIFFEHNTCLFAGYGWGHGQRPNPTGRHLCFSASSARISDFVIKYNIFYQSRGPSLFVHHWTRKNFMSVIMDNNCWYQKKGPFFSFKNKITTVVYTLSEFGLYQKIWNKGRHSTAAIPTFVDVDNFDFRQLKKSPCFPTTDILQQ